MALGKRGARKIAIDRSDELEEQAWKKMIKYHDEIAQEKDKIDDAGRGSRRAEAARKRILTLENKLDKVREKWSAEHMEPMSKSARLKDRRLVIDYGENAPEARSFGTRYPKAKHAGKVRTGVTSEDMMGMKKGGIIKKNTRPQMKHGGMHKGKQHSYVAGRSVKDMSKTAK